ncbi:hypothetical protein [Paenibacillus sp. MMS20-IR301]|uniref:hypothetical protein n=1 Tax=Paenibacillus sp. MMS20-IR301 TaxID=2895946 RepID=UPI0028EC08D3|nr:hypothetical protein [Paenibacillus sp. MMS20-IR301]WNS42720.1 hypothetical protein LOS79_27645 [Paenibacillus sp. MMS20-IR301]
MHADNGTAPDATRFLIFLRLLGSLIIIVFLQAIITLFAGFISALIIMFSSGYFWGDLAHVYPPDKLVRISLSYLLAGGLFALPWLGVWWMLYGLSEDRRIRFFPLLMLFAYLTFVVLFLQVNPAYNPDAMIPTSAGESTFLVCLGMSGVVLFPFYSAGVYHFVLKPAARPRKRYRFLLLCLLFAVIGLALLPLLWQLAPQLYPGLLDFPDL